VNHDTAGDCPNFRQVLAGPGCHPHIFAALINVLREQAFFCAVAFWSGPELAWQLCVRSLK
jgi:hypothetical protein